MTDAPNVFVPFTMEPSEVLEFAKEPCESRVRLFLHQWRECGVLYQAQKDCRRWTMTYEELDQTDVWLRSSHFRPLPSASVPDERIDSSVQVLRSADWEESALARARPSVVAMVTGGEGELSKRVKSCLRPVLPAAPCARLIDRHALGGHEAGADELRGLSAMLAQLDEANAEWVELACPYRTSREATEAKLRDATRGLGMAISWYPIPGGTFDTNVHDRLLGLFSDTDAASGSPRFAVQIGKGVAHLAAKTGQFSVARVRSGDFRAIWSGIVQHADRSRVGHPVPLLINSEPRARPVRPAA